MRSIRAIFRRGGGQSNQQNSKEGQQQQQNSQEELSRASSVSSLNAEQKQAKGAFAKLRKGVSKEKIDKIGTTGGDKANKNHDKKGVTKNNNKIPTEDDACTKESLLQELQEMAEEKSKLALQLGEKTGQLSVLRNEISKLKVRNV